MGVRVGMGAKIFTGAHVQAIAYNLVCIDMFMEVRVNACV